MPEPRIVLITEEELRQQLRDVIAANPFLVGCDAQLDEERQEDDTPPGG
jgi:hypothetical protein